MSRVFEAPDKAATKTSKDEVSEARCGTNSCKCKKPLEANPDWPLFVTREGWDKAMLLRKQISDRDQDDWGLYFFNDFSAYGAAEVLENAVGALVKSILLFA